jgi:hypothetical protein
MASNGVFKALNSEYKIERKTFDNFQLNAILNDGVDEKQIDHYVYYVQLDDDTTIRVGEH